MGILELECFVLEKPLRHMFSSVTSVAFFLIVNGFLLYWGEKMWGQGNKSIGAGIVEVPKKKVVIKGPGATRKPLAGNMKQKEL